MLKKCVSSSVSSMRSARWVALCFVTLFTGSCDSLFETLEFNCCCLNIWEFAVVRALCLDTVRTFEALHPQLTCSLFHYFVSPCSQFLAVVSMHLEAIMVTSRHVTSRHGHKPTTAFCSLRCCFVHCTGAAAQLLQQSQAQGSEEAQAWPTRQLWNHED